MPDDPICRVGPATVASVVYDHGPPTALATGANCHASFRLLFSVRLIPIGPHVLIAMVELTFEQIALESDRTVSGSVTRDDEDRLVLETEHENRPNFRVEGDRVVLLSASKDISIDAFGRNPRLSGYCQEHRINVDRIAGHDRCPKCRLEADARAREQEMHERRAAQNMHPTIDAPRY